MIRRWLQRSNRLSHEDASVRLEAIDSLSDAQAAKAQDTLVSLLKEDAEPDVRRAAALKVNSAEHLATQLDDVQISQAVAEILVNRARRSGTRIPEAYAAHPAIVEVRLNQADGDELLDLIEHIDDEQQLAELAVRSRGEARERLLAHAVLNTEAGLSTLEKLSRGKDKQCNRHARDQLDVLKRQRQSLKEQLQRIAEIDDSIHKELKHTPQQAEQVIAQRTKLRKLSLMRTEAADALRQLSPEESIPTDPLLDVDLYIPDAGASPFDALVDQLTELQSRMHAGEGLDTVRAARAEIAAAWLTAADRFPPNSSQHQQFEQVSALFRRYEAAWQRLAEDAWQEAAQMPNPDAGWVKTWRRRVKQLAWPADCAAPAEVAAVQAALALAESTLAADKAQLESQFKALADALAEAESAIESGQTQQAAQHLKAARDLAARTKSDPTTQQRLNGLSGRLNELRDWQKFATSPKRDALVKQMLQLAREPLEPTQQSTKIRELRQAWKALGPPASANDRELAAAFDSHAETAYEPCRVYYEAQNEQRAANLEERRAICAQLKTYLDSTDWGNADLKAADSILRTARDTWRRYHPCDRKALKPVQAEFDALQETLYSHLKTGWDKNVAVKKDIVSQAQALQELALDEQIERAKQLQQAWREVGPTPRGVDQRLWKEFRGFCDAVFERRDADRDSIRSQQQADFAALEQSITELESVVASQPDAKRFQLALDAVREARQAVKPAGAQLKRIDAAEQSFQQQRREAKQTAAKQRLQQMQAWDEAVAVAEANGGLSALTIDDTDPVFAARLEANAAPTDWYRLTLLAEVAAEIPSPAEDQTARMSIQVELMNDGVRSFDQAALDELVRQWCASGPQDEAVTGLRPRFFNAISAAAVK